MKSEVRALQEIKDLIDFASPQELFFDDDSFLKRPRWVKRFLLQYMDEINLPFYCNSRPESISIELCDLLIKARCAGIGIGLESGSQEIRTRILNRNLSDQQIIEAFNIAHRVGLKTWSFNMVGLPTETTDDINKTIELNSQIKTDNIRVSVYIPYPGTPLDSMFPSLMDIPKSYFDALSSLEPEKRIIVERWISDLRSENRLWNDD